MGDQVAGHSTTLRCVEDILGRIVLVGWADDVIA